MLYYHVSRENIERPSLVSCDRYCDLGEGFYLTNSTKAVESWSNRYKITGNKRAFIITFDVDSESVSRDLCSRTFLSYGQTCINYICDCRKGINGHNAFDAIITPLPTGELYKYLKYYELGKIDKTELLSLTAALEVPQQNIVVAKTPMFLCYLRYIKSVEV